MYLEKLNQQLDEFHLLKHPSYVASNNGELNQEILKDYAEQYYQHIKAFPRYISATHSICEDIENRKILLDNLSDEEDFNNFLQHRNRLNRILLKRLHERVELFFHDS